MEEIIPSRIASKRIKYLEINLIKVVKDLYLEKNKTLIKESEHNTNRRKGLPCLWIGRIHIVTVSLLPKSNLQIYM